MKRSKITTLNWLQYYGISRVLGASPAEAAEICSEVPEESVVRFEALMNMNSEILAARQAISQSDPTLNQIQNVIVALPVVGTVSKVFLWAASKLSGLVSNTLEWGCEKSCKGYDARNLVSLCPPPIGYIQGNMTPWIVGSMHDGLIADGLGPGDSPDALGRTVGVTGWQEPHCDKVGRGSGNSKPMNEMRRKLRRDDSVRNPWRLPSSPELPKGNYSEPWRDRGGNWYWRSYKVGKLLRWLERKMPCSTLMCVADTMRQTILGTRNLIETLPQEGQAVDAMEGGWRVGRGMGSRWYASVYYMHKDIWGLAQQLPVDEVVRVATELGCPDFAKWYKVRATANFTQAQLAKEPFPGFSATSTLSWGCAQKMIPALSAELIRRLPRMAPGAAWIRQHAGMLQRVDAPKRVASPGVLRLARMIHQSRVEEEKREKWVRYGVPIGIGVGLLVFGGGLYWYMTKDRER